MANRLNWARLSQVLVCASLLAYPAMVIFAVLGYRLSFAVAALLTLGVEVLLSGWAGSINGLLRLVGVGWTLRSVMRSLAVVLVVATSAGQSTTTLVTALAMLTLELSRVVLSTTEVLLRGRRVMHIMPRNIDLTPLRIPDLPSGPLDRIEPRRLTYLSALPPIGIVVGDLAGWPPADAIGAIAAAACALVVAGVAAAHRLPALRMPRRPAVTRLIRKRLAEYAPEVLLYFSGSSDSAYQINMWLDVLRKTDRRVLVLLREAAVLAELGPTTLPVLCIPQAPDVMELDFPSVRVALYAANAGKNIHLLRLPGMRHVFIGHGDSDKVASINPFCKVYDELWVAGPAGRERWARAAMGIDDANVYEVGRPQLDPIRRGTHAGGPLAVLYAPTWEGWTDEDYATSLISMGPTIVSTLLRHPDVKCVIYKPHPLTGTRLAKAGDISRRIIEMVDKANAAARQPQDPATAPELNRIRREIRRLASYGTADPTTIARDSGVHATDVDRVASLAGEWASVYWASGAGHRAVVDSLPTLYDCFNHVDLLISDISSVVADYLHSEKPYVVTNAKALDHETFRQLYPTAAAAELIDPGCAGLSDILTNLAAGVDRYADQRPKLKEHLLGADNPQRRFNAALDRAIDLADATPPPDWSVPVEQDL